MAQEAAADVETIVQNKVNRRSVFVGLVASTIAGKPAGAASLQEQIEQHAEALASSFQALHGRDCWIHIDHESGVVAVSLVFS